MYIQYTLRIFIDVDDDYEHDGGKETGRKEDVASGTRFYHMGQ